MDCADIDQTVQIVRYDLGSTTNLELKVKQKRNNFDHFFTFFGGGVGDIYVFFFKVVFNLEKTCQLQETTVGFPIPTQ